MKEHKNKVLHIGLIILLPLIFVLILCIVNFNAAAGKSMKLPLTTYKSTDKMNFTTYKGFGVSMVVHNSSNKEQEKIIKTIEYNEKAGNTDEWASGMNMTDYETYKDCLTKVNGQIINSVEKEDSIEYTFENNKTVKVNYTKTAEPTRSYKMTIDESDKEVDRIEKDNTVTTKYDSGMIKIEIDNTPNLGDIDFKSKYNIDVINLLLHYAVILATVIIVYMICRVIGARAAGNIATTKYKNE